MYIHVCISAYTHIFMYIFIYLSVCICAFIRLVKKTLDPELGGTRKRDHDEFRCSVRPC